MSDNTFSSTDIEVSINMKLEFFNGNGSSLEAPQSEFEGSIQANSLLSLDRMAEVDVVTTPSHSTKRFLGPTLDETQTQEKPISQSLQKITTKERREDVTQENVATPLLDEDMEAFFDSLDDIDKPPVLATVLTSPAISSLVNVEKLAEIKKKLDIFLSLDFGNAFHPSHQSDMDDIINLLQSYGGPESEYATFAYVLTSFSNITPEYESSIQTISAVESFLAEYASLYNQILLYRAKFRKYSIEIQPLMDEVTATEESMIKIDAQIKDMIAQQKKLQEEVVMKRKKVEDITNMRMKLTTQAKQVTECRQKMNSEIDLWIKRKEESIKKKVEIMKLWEDFKKICSSDH